jgi:hypothetical protein
VLGVQHAAGETGLRVFGLIMWSAAITSVIGASYTSLDRDPPALLRPGVKVRFVRREP